MKKKFGCLGMILLLMLSLCACVIKSNKPISAKKLDNMKTEYENYLKDKYPNETFTVDIWQEYGYSMIINWFWTERFNMMIKAKGYLLWIRVDEFQTVTFSICAG